MTRKKRKTTNKMTMENAHSAKMKKTIILMALLLLIVITPVLAHENEKEETHIEWTDPVLYLKIISVYLVLITIFLVAKWTTEVPEKAKRPFFLLVVIPVALVSIYLGAHTVYENIISDTGGPVHWHADYQVWTCGEKLDLIDPKGLSNKIGSPLFHEHNDDRIHVEGTVVSLPDVDLHEYFDVIGGWLTETEISYPTNDGMVEYKNGDRCPDGSTGTLKVYVNGKILENVQDYIISPHIFVPPGDCIIFLFDESTEETTDLICASWEAKGRTYEVEEDG